MKVLWHPISGHPAYICVLLLEWDFWEGASGLPQGRLSWYNPLICRSLNTAVTALYRSSPGWLGCFLYFSSLVTAKGTTTEQQHDNSTNPNATVRSMSAGIASFLLLTTTGLDRVCDDWATPQVSFSWNPTEILFSPHITCLQEIWVHALSGLFA